MEYRYLGRTGLKVSELCLGTMTFGADTDEQTSHKMLDLFVDKGGTFIDTADVYSAGGSEQILGNWLKTRDRDSLVIATKAYGTMGTGPNDGGNGRKHLVAAVEASLRRLGTDYIDLYQTHVFDDATPMEETLSTLDTLVRSGKVRFIGASNHTGWQLQKAVDLSRQHGYEPYVCLQPLYNLLERGAEFELVPVCLSEGLGLIAWSPLQRDGLPVSTGVEWTARRQAPGMTSPNPTGPASRGRPITMTAPGRSSTRSRLLPRQPAGRPHRWPSGGFCSAPVSRHRSSALVRCLN